MAELKNLIVNGSARINGDLFGEFKGTINGYKIVVVTSMPSNPDPNTIYIVK